jgi:hypothetical protein
MTFEPDDLTVLERMVDAYGLPRVIEALSEIAFLKADHLRQNWQDNISARTWETDARALSRTAIAVANRHYGPVQG